MLQVYPLLCVTLNVTCATCVLPVATAAPPCASLLCPLPCLHLPYCTPPHVPLHAPILSLCVPFCPLPTSHTTCQGHTVPPAHLMPPRHRRCRSWCEGHRARQRRFWGNRKLPAAVWRRQWLSFGTSSAKSKPSWQVALAWDGRVGMTGLSVPTLSPNLTLILYPCRGGS